MTWVELLRRQLPLAEQEIIILLTSPGSCPNKFFGSCAPRWNREKCLSKSCSKCWTGEVPPEVLAAHGLKMEFCQHEWGGIDYCPSHDYGDPGYPATECYYCRVRCVKCGLETSALAVYSEEANRSE